MTSSQLSLPHDIKNDNNVTSELKQKCLACCVRDQKETIESPLSQFAGI